MTPERWQQVKSLLAEVMEYPPGERPRILATRCGNDSELRQELESLVVFADGTTADATVPMIPHPGSGRTGSWIGQYHLENMLGEGGMGAVYLAYREVDGYQMKVALKIMRVAALSDYSLRRFRMERQILARLTHPNITRLIDGGVTGEGLPFLVTEYVDGTPLDRWCSETKPTLAQKLNVFLEVCRALSFAHRNLIVHGDIKPANILVTPESSAKLVDFGIARLIDPEAASPAATLTLALTPAWTSPEQLRGDQPSVLGDLYSLGRVLYFLLAGRHPFAFDQVAPHRYLDILSATPPLASHLAADPALRGDLDKIAGKSIEFEPAQRYQSADQFAEDIRCYLESRPVSARTTTWTYRASRFVRRNRAAVAAAAAMAMAIVVLVAVALWQAHEARAGYAVAAQQAQAVRRLANSFIFELDDAVAEMPGATQVRASIMQNAIVYLNRLERQASADTELQQELALAYLKVGDILGRAGSSNLGKSGEAMENYNKAEKILASTISEGKGDAKTRSHLATAYSRIAALDKVMGHHEAALANDQKSLEISRSLLEDAPDNLDLRRAVAQSLTSLGGTHSQLGDWPKVLENRRQALEMYEKLLTGEIKDLRDRRGLVLARTRLASILSHQNQHAAALEQLRLAVAEQKALYQEFPGNLPITMAYASALSAHARGLAAAGDHAGAIKLYEAALSHYETLVSVDRADVRSRSLRAATRAEIGRVMLRTGRPVVALRYFQAALGERLELAERDAKNAGALGEVAQSYSDLGDVHKALHHPQAALRAYSRAREILTGMEERHQTNAGDKALLARVILALRR